MTEMYRGAAIALAVAIFLPLQTNAAQQTPPPIREFDIPTIERFGKEMYAQDKLAWVATDVLTAKVSERTAQREGVRGWITDTVDGKDIVRFIRRTRQVTEIAYDVTFVPDVAPVLSIPADRTMTQAELAQYNARQLALDNIGQRCSNRYNTVLLKDPESDGWLVWALAASTDADVMLLGGHYRFTVSADGTTIRSKDALSVGCREFNKREQAREAARRNSTDTGTIGINHIVSRTPVEIHTFASLSYDRVFYVGTNDGKAWKADKGLLATVELDAPDLDGASARFLAGLDEQCTVIATKLNENPRRFYLGARDLRVILPTENQQKFAVQVERGMLGVGLVCIRLDIVPAPNDYKVIEAGLGLSIGDKGDGHPDRLGKLDRVDGKFSFKIVEGEPLTDELAARVQKRLEAFDQAATPGN
jgi:hypothetical protein